VGFWAGFPQQLVSCFKVWAYHSEFQLIDAGTFRKTAGFYPPEPPVCSVWHAKLATIQPSNGTNMSVIYLHRKRQVGGDRRMSLLGVLVLSLALLLVSSLLIDRSAGEQSGFFQRIQDMRIRSGE